METYMEKVKVNLKNCYGIKSLEYVFDTIKGRAFLLYAPNGSMKTSFAKIFSDISQGKAPSDVVFPLRDTQFSIKEEGGSEISGDRIFVVEPYQESFTSTKTATLLVNQELRIQYENLLETIKAKADQILKKLGEFSKTKKNVQHEITLAFGLNEKEILPLLESISMTISQDSNPGLQEIVYTEIFNDKVLAFLSSTEIRQQLQEYVERYNELLEKSAYFRKGLFDHNNASNVCKSLNENGFFSAHHRVLLTNPDSANVEISTQTDLDNVIASEKQQILRDPELAKRFESIDKAITRNVELRQFRRYLESHSSIIPDATVKLLQSGRPQ